MRGYDNERDDNYEDEGQEEYEEEGREEYAEEEEEPCKPSNEEVEYQELRQKLKESLRKQMKQESSGSSTSCPDPVAPYDKMGSREAKSISVLEEEIFHKFRDFMTGITKIDELGIAGNRLLSGFQQALEYIWKPPIDTNSKLINKIIEANETKRVKTYVNSGCRKLNDSVQSVTNSKEILNELEDLLGDVTSAIQSTHENLSALSCLESDVELNEQEEIDAFSHSPSPDITTMRKKKDTNVTHLDGLMAIIHSMVKQDYLMQEKIVSALDPKLSSQELESYCQMWALRPFINDEIMQLAWQHIH